MISTLERLGSSLPFFDGVATANVDSWRRATEARTRPPRAGEAPRGLNPTKAERDRSGGGGAGGGSASGGKGKRRLFDGAASPGATSRARGFARRVRAGARRGERSAATGDRGRRTLNARGGRHGGHVPEVRLGEREETWGRGREGARGGRQNRQPGVTQSGDVIGETRAALGRAETRRGASCAPMGASEMGRRRDPRDAHLLRALNEASRAESCAAPRRLHRGRPETTTSVTSVRLQPRRAISMWEKRTAT